ncbi:winged helix-turn-helix domain-containing protein [Enterovibrio sp. ZSDZ35]|uniref:Winged helix-turn-helix domain-containing protein n=1 Tax=Enterovibrio qingdaonensis TaxID=2899818 RepID=A0ABT5QKK3_9GAMM|nr:winged helix-turn-helix domain-containing protein [Enterovibrio sp. ZSDZ35]MDD1780826.1 winged helix-turn-helix domain-containing protein [Enterovibrio sp. ZSDZ35]
MQFAGVITGDIVGSTTMDETSRRAALAVLEDVFSLFEESITGDIYRGDAFQVYTEQPELLLHIALAVRIRLLSLDMPSDVRLSLSVASATPRELPVRLANNSEAFLLSGRHLDGMTNERLVFSADEATLTEDVNLVLTLIDGYISSLTSKMALALRVWLENPGLSHAELAEKLGISRSAFTRIINRANYVRIDETCRWYANRVARYISEH